MESSRAENSEKKKELRQQIRPLWQSSLQNRSLISNIMNNLEQYLRQNLSSSDRLVAYLALPDEIDILPLLGQFNNQIYAPITGSEGQMEFHLLMEGGEIQGKTEKYKYGILGPAEASQELNKPLRPSDIIIIPTRGVNPRGFRLGRGGGYYDRQSDNLKLVKKVGLLPETLCDLDFSAENFDIALDLAITERGIKNFLRPETEK